MMKSLIFILAFLIGKVHASSSSSYTTTLDEPFQTSFARLDHSACVSLFYRGGRMGCSTESREVQTGELQYFDPSVKFPAYNDPYTLVMDESSLTSTNIQTIVANNKWGLLKGILVLNSTDDSSYYSPGPQAPQGRKTPSKNVNYGSFNYAWNSIGDGLYLLDLFGVPIAYLNQADISSYIRDVSQDGDSSIVAEFNYYMGPSSMDSSKCLSWYDTDGQWSPKCLPLGGTSVWAVAGSPEVVEERRQLEDGGGGSSRRPVVMVATSMDSTSMFHEAVPAANTAASNILTLLMAAKILGESVDDATLDALPNRILFGFFQGETYGFIGSRTFLRDVAYPGFECDADKTVNAVIAKSNFNETACLYPLRHSLEFQKLGDIAGMIAVDQVGMLATENTMYAQTDGSNFGGFVSNVLQASGTNSFSAAASDVAGQYYPPSPMTSLLALSEGAVGGAILTGYNDVFVDAAYFESHKDSVKTQDMDLDAIAAAATLLARAALAAAYDDGSYDSDTSSSYALNLISELSSDDETLLTLANCLYVDASCEFLHEYARAEDLNEKLRSGMDLGIGLPFGSPEPNYYVSVFNANNGQPFVQVGDTRYGAYNGDDYGKKNSDAFSARPTLLEQSIRGMLNDFLGRGSVDDSGSVPSSLSSCSNNNDCSGVSYCAQESDYAVCTAKKVCVCSRSHYHLALDEALEAAPNNLTGYFIVSENDEGISAMYTEPNWSNDVGVRVYRNAGRGAGFAVLGVGIVMVTLSAGAAAFLQRRMKKEKLY